MQTPRPDVPLDAGPGLANTNAFDVFWNYLERHGVTRAQIADRLEAEGIERDRVLTPNVWVPYGLFVAVEHAVGDALPDDPQRYFEIGRSIGPTEGLGFLRKLSRGLLSPRLLYNAMPRLMGRFLFRFVQARFEAIAPGRLRGVYRFADDCPPTDAFLETARGVLSSMPVMLLDAPAEVVIRRTGPLDVEVDVSIATWRGASGVLREWLRRLRLAFSSRAEMLEGIEQAHADLQDRVAELEALKSTLALQVAERTAALETARAELERSVERLHQSDRARLAFFTNVSHEFKTPLTLIHSVVEEFERGDCEPEQAASALRRHAGALLGLINELLDFSRLDEGRMPVRPSAFDLRAALHALLDDLAPLADARGLQLRRQLGDAPADVELDRTLVQRAVLNLVVNAIKYIRPGDLITVRLAFAAASVRIEVADTGPGIAEDERTKIFERFGRARDADGRAIEGSGIGLAMVHEIATLHGGTLELDSLVGAGATFRLELPRVAVRAADSSLDPVAADDATQVAALVQAARHTLTPPAPTTTGLEGAVPMLATPTPAAPPVVATVGGSAAPSPDWQGPRGHVLVVDDNEELRSWMARVVARHHRVSVAADGVEALECVRRDPPDVVVSDVMMPRLDGLGLVRALRDRAETAHVGIILVTARHGQEPLLEGYAARCDDFVRKPFPADELLARVATQVRMRHLQQTLVRAEKAQLLSALSAGMAHEVLNPVNALLQSVRLLREEPAVSHLGEQDRVELLGAIERGGLRVQRIVEAVQRFARPDGRRDGAEPVALAAQWQALEPLFAHRVGGPVQLQASLGDARVQARPELLDQAISNLVLNALDAVGDSGTVRVDVQRQGPQWVLAVQDDGPGVPAAARERIFTPFFTTKDPGKGTGMGLAIAAEIAALHGGRLRYVDPPEGGARFELWLPAVDAA